MITKQELGKMGFMMDEFKTTNFAKLNCIQQKIADLFQSESLTRPEVFAVLKGMREFKMVNKDLANKWFDEIKYGDKFNGFGSHPFLFKKDGV